VSDAPLHDELVCITADEAATEALGAAIGRALRGGDVVALEGSLGAGKTRLVRGIARGLAIDPGAVSSPTFVLVQEYAADEGDVVLAHVDAWRLDGPEAVDGIGWDEFAGEPDVVTVVEWASRIAAAMPPETVWIELESDADEDGDAAADGSASRRRITLRDGGAGAGDVGRRVADAMRAHRG
jgi:tRNA threonylcarbamoyladenosine biosynthesis protein TsaE